MSDTTTPAPAVGAVHPAPTDEEAAAIVAAIEVSWPRGAAPSLPDTEVPRWRCSTA